MGKRLTPRQVHPMARLITASLLASASACSLSADSVPGATLRGHGAGAALETRRWYYESYEDVPQG